MSNQSARDRCVMATQGGNPPRCVSIGHSHLDPYNPSQDRTDLNMRVRELETEREALKVAWRHSYERERALADELGKALESHMLVYGVDWEGCNEFKRTDEELLAKWRAARQAGTQDV